MSRYTGMELKRFAAVEPRKPIQVGNTPARKIISAINAHVGIPKRETLARKLRINPIVFRDIVTGNPTVREAWHAKVTAEVEKLQLDKLFDIQTARLCREVPTAVQRRSERIIELMAPRLSVFNGRLSFPEVARHVAQAKHKEANLLLAKDPALRKAVEARFLEILTFTKPHEIKRRALHRDAAKISDKLKRFAMDKLAAAGITVNVQEKDPLL